MKKLLPLLCFVTLVLLACKKEQPDSIYFDALFSVGYRDSNNNDLLDPAQPNAIKAADIDIFVLKNGVKKQIHYDRYDYPELFYIEKSSIGTYFLTMYFDSNAGCFDGNKVTQFIRYKDGSEDMFVGEFNTDRSINTILLKLSINGVLKWERAQNEIKPAPVVIVK